MSLIRERVHVDDDNYLEHLFDESNVALKGRCVLGDKTASEEAADSATDRPCP